MLITFYQFLAAEIGVKHRMIAYLIGTRELSSIFAWPRVSSTTLIQRSARLGKTQRLFVTINRPQKACKSNDHFDGSAIAHHDWLKWRMYTTCLLMFKQKSSVNESVNRRALQMRKAREYIRTDHHRHWLRFGSSSVVGEKVNSCQRSIYPFSKVVWCVFNWKLLNQSKTIKFSSV